MIFDGASFAKRQGQLPGFFTSKCLRKQIERVDALYRSYIHISKPPFFVFMRQISPFFVGLGSCLSCRQVATTDHCTWRDHCRGQTISAEFLEELQGATPAVFAGHCAEVGIVRNDVLGFPYNPSWQGWYGRDVAFFAEVTKMTSVKLVQVLPSSESKTLEVPRNAKGASAVFTAHVVVHVAVKPSLEYQRGNRSETWQPETQVDSVNFTQRKREEETSPNPFSPRVQVQAGFPSVHQDHQQRRRVRIGPRAKSHHVREQKVVELHKHNSCTAATPEGVDQG